MPREYRYYVYILTSGSRRVLYTRVTNDIFYRREGHLKSDDSTFAGKYKAFRLVYLEEFKYVRNAIAREKQIKGWTRAKKEALVRSVNPQWRDLSADWGKQYKPAHKPQDPSRQKEGAQDDKSKAATLNSNFATVLIH